MLGALLVHLLGRLAGLLSEVQDLTVRSVPVFPAAWFPSQVYLSGVLSEVGGSDCPVSFPGAAVFSISLCLSGLVFFFREDCPVRLPFSSVSVSSFPLAVLFLCLLVCPVSS